MLVSRRVINYGAICLTTLVVLCAVTVTTPSIVPWGRMVVAPASLDGMVTISTSPDKTLTFITCAPYHPTFWRRLVHSTLIGAFVVQHRGPTRNAVAHAGRAHIDFQGDLLKVVFADSSQFVFTTAQKQSIPLEEGEVDYSLGLGTYGVTGFSTHAEFVASRDWTDRNSCGL
jgi:hypothetical protein